MTIDPSGATVFAAILQMKKMLGHVDGWLVKVAEHASALAFDPDVLVGARLAPDQVPLVRQVQNACDRAKYAAARLAGTDAPRHPDTETTIGELRARIATCTSYLAAFGAADFDGAATRTVTLPFLDDRAMPGEAYLRELALPGFYFHVTTAYAILRHNGVRLTMRDFIGETSLVR
jgi:hypothetical protein